MYDIVYTNRFKKSLKKCAKRKEFDRQSLQDVVDLLQNECVLPQRYRAHILSGTYEGIWECHVQSDLLLLWNRNDTDHTLEFIDIGTHSEVF